MVIQPWTTTEKYLNLCNVSSYRPYTYHNANTVRSIKLVCQSTYQNMQRTYVTTSKPTKCIFKTVIIKSLIRHMQYMCSLVHVYLRFVSLKATATCTDLSKYHPVQTLPDNTQPSSLQRGHR